MELNYNIEVKVEIKNGKEWVYRAMLSTQGKKAKENKSLSDKTRHEEIGKDVATSSPDIKSGSVIVKSNQQYRSLSLSINAKRMIEIAEQRLCKGAFVETTAFVKEIIKNIPDLHLKNLCCEPCVRTNCCIDKKKCGFINLP